MNGSATIREIGDFRKARFLSQSRCATLEKLIEESKLSYDSESLGPEQRLGVPRLVPQIG
jgi:hypothetical protein